jgi:hypothetical protein
MLSNATKITRSACLRCTYWRRKASRKRRATRCRRRCRGWKNRHPPSSGDAGRDAVPIVAVLIAGSEAGGLGGSAAISADSETTGATLLAREADTPRLRGADPTDFGACEPVWPIRSRHEYAIGVAVIEMAPDDTTVGSTPTSCAIFTKSTPAAGPAPFQPCGKSRRALARWLLFTNRGEFRSGGQDEIMNKASCLSSLSNVVLVSSRLTISAPSQEAGIRRTDRPHNWNHTDHGNAPRLARRRVFPRRDPSACDRASDKRR